MLIDYKKISLAELERLDFLHKGYFTFECDGDRKVIVFKAVGEEDE